MMSEKNKSIRLLQELTLKKHVFFTDRGNSSILLALKLAKHLGKTHMFIQDQGGWITYEQFAKKLGFNLSFLKTDFGIVNKIDLKKLGSDSVLLINSMPGYFTLQENMKEIYEQCKQNKIFVINDASGSIGREAAKHGDLVIGSFGRWKPLAVEYGGFIAFDEDYAAFFKENFTTEIRDFSKELEHKLDLLPMKIKLLTETSHKIKQDLKDFDIIHREGSGPNVIVRFKSDVEKQKIIDYCNSHKYEFTLCPRYIRVMEDAVSIEVNRLGI
jgi:hypothetical protein